MGTKHLNGLTGVICKHPKEGHPSFIRKPACPEKARLTVCIAFDDSSSARTKSALIEPRFIKSFEEVAHSKALDLGRVAEVILSRSASDEVAEHCAPEGTA